MQRGGAFLRATPPWKTASKFNQPPWERLIPAPAVIMAVAMPAVQVKAPAGQAFHKEAVIVAVIIIPPALGVIIHAAIDVIRIAVINRLRSRPGHNDLVHATG